MAKKKDVHYKIDERIVNDFNKIIDYKKKKGDGQTITYSGVIENFMKEYIAQDGEMVVDEMHAPRIKHVVQQAVRNEMNQIKGLIRKTEIDSTATLYSSPVLFRNTVKAFEDVLDQYLNPQLLNGERTRISDNVGTNRKQTISTLRKIAVEDHKEQMKEKSVEDKAKLHI